MPLGPMEYVVLEFRGNQMQGEIASALRDVVARGVIRIADLVVVKKDQDGDVTMLELSDLGKNAAAWKPLVEDATNLLSVEDVEQLSQDLKPNSSAAIILFEHCWAARLRQVILNAQGRLIADGFVSPEAVEEVLRQRRGAAA